MRNVEDPIIGMQFSNLSGNNVNGKTVTSESLLYVDIHKTRILELEKQLSEKNAIIDILSTMWVANSQYISKSNCSHNISKTNALTKIKIMTTYMKKKALKIYQAR